MVLSCWHGGKITHVLDSTIYYSSGPSSQAFLLPTLLQHLLLCEGLTTQRTPGCSLRLSAAAAVAEECARTVTVLGRVFHLGIYVVEKGDGVQDAQRLCLDGLHLIYARVYRGMDCSEKAAEHTRLQL